MALGSAVVPDEVRGSGLALLGSATSLARLVASVAFGGLWTPSASRRRSCASASGSSSPARSPRSSCCARRSRAWCATAAIVFARPAGAVRARAPPSRSSAGARAGRRRCGGTSDALAERAARAERPTVVFRSSTAATRRTRAARARPVTPVSGRTTLPLRCERVALRGRERDLLDPRRRVRRRLPGADLRHRPEGPRLGRRRRHPEPRARVARRSLRDGHAVRHRPLLRGGGRVLDADHADRPRSRHASSPTSRTSRSSSDGRQVTAVDRNFWGVTFCRATATASTRRWPPAARRT